MADRLTIGREGCDYVITGDDYVSTVHAVVWTDDHGYTWVRDLGSTNGVRIIPAGQDPGRGHLQALLRSVPVRHTARLNDGDTLIIGRTLIRWPIRRDPLRVEAEVGEPIRRPPDV